MKLIAMAKSSLRSKWSALRFQKLWLLLGLSGSRSSCWRGKIKGMWKRGSDCARLLFFQGFGAEIRTRQCRVLPKGVRVGAASKGWLQHCCSHCAHKEQGNFFRKKHRTPKFIFTAFRVFHDSEGRKPVSTQTLLIWNDLGENFPIWLRWYLRPWKKTAC